MFERYVTFVVRHRVAVIIGVLLVTVALATQLRHIHFEIKRRAQLPQAHPYVRIENRMIDLFGGEKIVVLGIVATEGHIFTPSTLAKLYRITERLLALPGIIETNVVSLASPYVKAVTPGMDGTIEVRPIMTQQPSTADQVKMVQELVEGDAFLRANLVAADQSATVVVAEFDDRISDTMIRSAIEEVVKSERDPTVTFPLAGAPILRAELTRYTRLIAVLFPIAVVIIALVHYEAFRTLQAMLLPLMTALLSVIWALGLVGCTRQALDTWGAITPVVILAVAAGHAIQILKRFYEEYAEFPHNETAVIKSVTKVGPVMLTAGLIASAGFASLMTFGVDSVRTFGMLLAGGIVSALVIELTFTPSVRALLHAPAQDELRRASSMGRFDHGLDRAGDALVRHPWTILFASVGVCALALIGATGIRVDNSFRSWFPPTSQIRRDDAVLNERLPGSSSLRVLVEGDHDGVITDPAVLNAIDDLERFMESDSRVAGVVSIVSHVKRINQAMHGGNAAFFAIPSDRELINEYLILYGFGAGPDDLSAFVDARRRAALIRALSKADSAEFSRHYLDRLQSYAQQRFTDLPVRVGIAGGTLGVQTAMNDLVVREKALNIAQVALIIVVLSAVAMRSLVAGFLVLVPLVLAVVVTLGIMGWGHIWLDMTTAALTAMGVSIGADFAIYLLFRVREELAKQRGMQDAVLVALRTSGKAVLFVSSAVVLGYLVLPLSGFSIWRRLGVLTATLIGSSALASLTVIPSLVLLLRPRFLSSASEHQAGIGAAVPVAGDQHVF